MKRALVTGGTGFLGRHLVNALREDGWEVRVLVRNKSKQKDNIDPRIDYHEGDLTRPETLIGAAEGIIVLFHLAAQLGEWGVPQSTFEAVNIEGTQHLIDLCRIHKGIRFVFASTPGVQGKGHRQAQEDLPYNPPYLYEKSKCQAEKLVRRAHDIENLQTVIIRPDFVYGPGDHRRIALYRAIQRHRFYVIGNGQSIMHPTYVTDAVQGFLLAATQAEAAGQVYNIAGPQLMTVDEYVCTIAKALGIRPPRLKIPKTMAYLAALGFETLSRIRHRAPFVSRSKIEFLTKDHGCDIGRARKHLGYHPKTDFSEGMKLTLDWAKESGKL
jgi:UDP-glucose 4-epimerase